VTLRVAIVAVALAGSASGAAGPKVTLTPSTHTPKVEARWPYTVRATLGRTPVAARITVQIVDPIGGAHAVEYGDTTRKIVNRPFRGVFRDFVRWPPESRGIPLTFRATVVAAGAKRVLSYRVTPRG
jgi:hypothetical protein